MAQIGIAKDNGSTEAVVRALNPHVHFDRLKPGTTITVQKAGLETVIIGWDPIDPQSIAQLYNANGRGEYRAELTFAYDLIKHDKFLQ